MGSLNAHKRAVHDNVAVICDLCDKIFDNKTKLNSHKSKVHNKDKKKDIKCDYCDYTTKRKDVLKSHIENNHQLE